MIRVLFVVSESVPFIKTGGLADVAFSLPKALRGVGIDIRVVMPLYKDIPEEYKKNMTTLIETTVSVGWRNQYCGIKYMEYEGVPFYFIDNEYYFKRNRIYGFYDDGEIFAFYDRAVLEMIEYINFIPHIIHCNDWHTGMISPLLHAHYHHKTNYHKIKTIFTIHNLKYQGIFSKEILGDLLSLGEEYCNMEALEFYGGVSFMKGGIKYSNLVTTVSESYANEIQEPYYGEKLDGILRHRGHDLYGIVNGIDYDIFNPEKDPDIFENYNVECIHKKETNKLMLQELLGLPQEKDVPIIGIVSRIDNMKGFDLIFHVIEELMSLNIQLIILGTGDNHLESVLRHFAYKYKEKLSANIKFSASLAQKIYSGVDMLLMPSLFEPCGLSQLIALRYGTIPIVREVGGLKDTVTSYNEFTGEGNGFSFSNYNAHDMLYTIERAISFYHNKSIWDNLIQNAMNGEYDWKNSAAKYKKLYEKLYEDNIE